MLPFIVLLIRCELVLIKGRTVSGYWQLSTECCPMIASLKILMFDLFIRSWALVKVSLYAADIKEKMHCMEERALKKYIIK